MCKYVLVNGSEYKEAEWEPKAGIQQNEQLYCTTNSVPLPGWAWGGEQGNCLRWSEQEGERSWPLSLWVDVEEGAGLAGLVAQEKNWTRSCPLYLEHIG